MTWDDGKLLAILRWLEGNEYLTKVPMLNVYSIVPFFTEKHEFQIDFVAAQSFVGGRAVIHPLV